MADTMTPEQVLLDMADCQGNRGVGHTYSRLTSWRLAIDAAIKQREQDAKDAARYRWLRKQHNSSIPSWHVRSSTNSIPLDLDIELDAAMAKESGR